MKDLTAQQSKVLNCIEESINKTGFPPTRAEICQKLGFKSPNAAESHLRALEKKDIISIAGGSSRGISIKNKKSSSGGSVPVIGLVAAGSATLASENIEREINVDPSLFSRNVDYFLKVKGLSMIEDGIYEDDLVAIHKTNDFKNGDLAVVRTEDDVTLKYIFKENHKLLLKPANKDFDPIHIDLRNESAEVEGIGVGLIRNN